MHDEVRFSMPPQPGVWQGRDVVVGSWVEGGFGTEAFGSLRLAVTRFNRQLAVANYVRKPGDRAYSPLALDVLRIAEGKIVEIVTFDGSLFDTLGLPSRYDGAREHVVNAAASVVHEDRQEAGEQR